MKSSRTAIENRRKQIILELKRDENISVEALASALNASALTIRRDLDCLEERGVLKRCYGGAKLCAGSDQPIRQVNDLLACRRGIAKCAASHVSDGDTIFINSSSTALMMVQFITARGVTVITNNGKALGIDTPQDVTVVLTGGELRNPKASMTGDFAINNLCRVTAAKAFLGCSGLTVEEGFTTASTQEVAVNKIMFERVTGERFILADHTKIGRRHSFISGSPELIDYVITDNKVEYSALEPLEVKDIRIIQVEPLY